jgi:conjugative relaxase-like TrwC/TraI family protein
VKLVGIDVALLTFGETFCFPSTSNRHHFFRLHFCMLRIAQQTSSDAAKAYYASADYYMEGRELLGRWRGEWARMLGLEGQVSGRAFNRLCESRNPSTGDPLTQRTKDDRAVGYDFTFSVPKSVSLLHSIGDDPDILVGFRESVLETIQDIEKEMKVRVRTRGKKFRASDRQCYMGRVHPHHLAAREWCS